MMELGECFFGYKKMGNVLKAIPTYWLVTLSSLVSKIITATVQLFVMKYLLDALGVDSFSTYSLLTGIAAWALLAEFGVGHSLQNYISEQRAAGRNIGDYIASAIIFLIPLLIIVLILVVFSSSWLSLLYLKSNSVLSDSEKSQLFMFVSFIFIMSSVGGISYKVLYALQKGWLANVYTSLGSLLGLINLLVFNNFWFDLTILSALILFYSPSAILAFSILIRLTIVNKQYFNFRNKIAIFSGIAKRSMSFWIFAILSALVLQADYLVMSQKLDPEQIIEYVVLLKIFSLSIFLYQALLQALWPVCAELRANEKWEDLKNIINKYLMLAIGAIIVFTLFIVMFRTNIFLLINEDLYINPITLLLFGLYFIIRAWTDTYAVLLQSMNLLKPLWILVPIQAVFSITLQWVLSEKYGVNGLVMGLILSFILTVSICLPCYFYFIINSKIKSLNRGEYGI